MTDAGSLKAVIEEAQPDEIYSLASQSHVKVSFDVPEYTTDVTGLGTLRLLQVMRDLGCNARFFHAGSSEQFGKVSESPQNESTPFYPRSPYACAKVFAFDITRNYRDAYGMFAVSGIFFNHESPRRGESFVTRKITRGVAAIAHGHQDKLFLGNLDARRDWGFAGDYVEAMWLMLQADEPDDYVIATGETHSVREFCEKAFAHAGLPLKWRGSGIDQQGVGPDGRTLVEVDSRYFRPAEVDLLLGDASKARDRLGWRPSVGFEQLVTMMVDADLANVVPLQRRDRG
jgi:GDPmannose 4,6-dehydratase